MNIKNCLLLGSLVLFAGCTHIQDLIACQPPQKNPEPFGIEHVGWDHRSVDEVRCSNEQLKVVQLARIQREASAVNR
ncbi:hypothetical protein M1D58_27685 (plasmid) [Pseudomonas sp. R4-76]|uniref:hypothetical protein n=1 Tax=unclassified Pseudomonas TaxID=196821 RepID=UPI003DA8A0F1